MAYLKKVFAPAILPRALFQNRLSKQYVMYATAEHALAGQGLHKNWQGQGDCE